jgi:hypothetical protein
VSEGDEQSNTEKRRRRVASKVSSGATRASESDQQMSGEKRKIRSENRRFLGATSAFDSDKTLSREERKLRSASQRESTIKLHSSKAVSDNRRPLRKEGREARQSRQESPQGFVDPPLSIQAFEVNNGNAVNSNHRVSMEKIPRAQQLEQAEREMQKPQDRDENESQRSKRKLRVILSFFFCFIAIVAGVVYFITDKTTTTTESPQTVIGISPSMLPVSNSPSKDLSFYDPPSPDTCSIIAEGQNTMDQSDMIAESFIVSLEGTLIFEVGPDIWESALKELKQKIQQRMMPAIAGCPEDRFDGRNLRRKGRVDLAMEPRHLDVTELLIRIANALVETRYNWLEACSDAAICIDIMVIVYSEDVIDPTVMSNHIEGVFNSKDSLPIFLELDLFANLDVTDVDTYIPTSTPSTTPTMSLHPTFNGQTFPPTKRPSMTPSQL